MLVYLSGRGPTCTVESRVTIRPVFPGHVISGLQLIHQVARQFLTRAGVRTSARYITIARPIPRGLRVSVFGVSH